MPSAQPPQAPATVAIIGAGLAGVVLALALQKQNIEAHIYELREDSYSSGGSLTLQPNGLRVLDAVGVYARLRPLGFPFESITLHNLDTGTSTTEGAGLEAAYGYQTLRILRRALIDELRAVAAERGISIEYGFRFSHVVDEDNGTGLVTFASADGATRQAGLLVGADGIHSRVRARISSIVPEYTGMLGIGGFVPRTALDTQAEHGEPLKNGYTLPLNFRGKGTAVIMVPHTPEGSSIAVMRGSKVPDRSREAWEEFSSDKQALRKLFCAGLEEYPELAKVAVEAADPADYIFWPVQQMPRLDSWESPEGRVVVLGDAAHALSPTTGQGANQAFEDAYMLGLVLGKVHGKLTLQDALKFWQHERMERVYGMVDRYFGKQAGGKDPIELRSAKLGHEDKGRGDAWLYDIDLAGKVEAWAQEERR